MEGKDRLNNLKEEYVNIPVPTAAYDRMKQGIKQAKEEKRRKIIMRSLKRTGAAAAAVLLTIGVMANLSSVTASAMEDIPVLGAIAKVVTFRTFEDEKGNYDAKIDIPKVSIGNNDSGQVNRSIEDYANQLIKEYEKQVTADLAGDGHYSVTSSYEVIADNETYLSLRINTTVIMASGAESVKIFNIDKKTGKEISLKDLLADKPGYQEAITESIKTQMKDQMSKDDSLIYFDKEKDGEGFDRITGEENFYFNKNGELVIVFDEYEVAPGYMGSVEFTIPKSTVEF